MVSTFCQKFSELSSVLFFYQSIWEAHRYCRYDFLPSEKKPWLPKTVGIFCVSSGYVVVPSSHSFKTGFNSPRTCIQVANFPCYLSRLACLHSPTHFNTQCCLMASACKGLDSLSAKLLEPRISGWLTFSLCQSSAPTHRPWWGLGELTSLQPSRASRVGGLNQLLIVSFLLKC